MRTIVDTVPTGLLVLLVIGSIVGVVLLGALAMRRFAPATREEFDAFRQGALAPRLEDSR
ncbi:hypothetical protein [Gaiella sp.]|uniref:hypothetical protein n=1 Tax=Gaiella sp. TaxID=2663207 RepID=UPI00398380AF